MIRWPRRFTSTSRLGAVWRGRCSACSETFSPASNGSRGTGPWYGVRYTNSTFGIFEAFPDEASRQAHLNGEGARILVERASVLLAAPARIDKLDVLMSKQAFAERSAASARAAE